MRVYIAGATSARQYVKSYRSSMELRKHSDDLVAEPEDFGPGETTRIRFGEDFLRNKREFDAIFLMDLDMEFPVDALEKMRAHDLDMVTGHYFRRSTRPLMSICTVGDEWPFVPLIDIPTSGLHKVATSGFGCALIKREVVEAVASVVPDGEPMFSTGAMPEVTGDHSHFGSDVRFFTRAGRMGYDLWLDASIECAHGSTIWLTKKLYDILFPYQKDAWDKYLGATEELMRRHGMDEAAARLRIKQLEAAREEVETTLKVIDGQIAERELDLPENRMQKLNVPVISDKELERRKANRGKGPGGEDRAEVAEARQEVYKNEAEKVIDALQDEGN